MHASIYLVLVSAYIAASKMCRTECFRNQNLYVTFCVCRRCCYATKPSPNMRLVNDAVVRKQREMNA